MMSMRVFTALLQRATAGLLWEFTTLAYRYKAWEVYDAF